MSNGLREREKEKEKERTMEVDEAISVVKEKLDSLTEAVDNLKALVLSTPKEVDHD